MESSNGVVGSSWCQRRGLRLESGSCQCAMLSEIGNLLLSSCNMTQKALKQLKILNPFKSLSLRKPCKIVHKQGWPILIIFGGLEDLCTSIPNILYFLSEIQNGRRTGRHLYFPILGLKCP